MRDFRGLLQKVWCIIFKSSTWVFGVLKSNMIVMILNPMGVQASYPYI